MRYSPGFRPRLAPLMVFGALAAVFSITLGSSSSSAERNRNFRLRSKAPLSARSGMRAATFAGPFTVDTTSDTHAVSPASSALDSTGHTSLRSAIEAANAQGGTTVINVPPGTYNLSASPFELQVGSDAGENITINGTGTPANTTIHQTVAGNRVFDLDFNFAGDVAVTISNVTISGGVGDLFGGGAIVGGDPGDVLTVSNCVITGNSTTATNNGGGISISGGGDLIIQNGTVISNNTATQGVGGGVFFDNGTNPGNLTITNSTIANNTASSGAGAGQGGGAFIVVAAGSTGTIQRSVFANNSAQTPVGQGGGMYVGSGIIDVSYSAIIDNAAASGSGVYSVLGGTTTTANDNWWGCNNGPGSGAGCSAAANAAQNTTALTWLQLRAAASPSSICTGGTSTVTADIKGRNSGAPLTTELNGLPAFPITPTTIFSNPVLGSISGASTQFMAGVATATYTAGGTGGSGSVDATAEQQTVTASITVQTNTTTNPGDQAVCQGTTATFSTTASGPGPIHYAWTLDGSPFNGDNPSISIPTGSLSLGPHSVNVTATGACGSASQTATLTVQANTSTSTPADQTVCQGTSANFSTTASGTAPFHYAWTVDSSPFDGDNSSISVPTGSLSVGSHTVSVTVTGTCGSDTKSATLTVQANTSTTAPADQTVCQGASANFSTTASGTAPFHYAWTVDSSPVGGDSSSVSVPTGSLSVGSHTVSVTVTGTCGSDSKSATLTVQENTSATTPANQTVCPGATANFSTTASGTGPFHYAWTLDGSPFNGDSSSISVPTGSLSSGNHPVTVTVSGTCGSVIKSATLTVKQNTSTTRPADQTVCAGSTASFSTTASGTGPFTFVWKKGSTVLHTGDLGGRVTITSGSSTSTLMISNVQSTDAGTYSVETTGACGTATQSATLALDSTPPTITCPSNITVEPTCPSGAVVTYATPVGMDNCSGATTTRTAGLASGSVFPIGTTTVTYTVTDTSGNSASCSFTVTVETPAQVIQDLINRVQTLINQGVLNQPNGQGLINKLNSVLSDLNSGNTAKACDDLGSFIDKVQGYIQHGTLTSAQGQPLIDSAMRVKNTLGCSGTSGTCT